MDNAVLEVVLKARDEASAVIKNMGKSLGDAQKGADIVNGAILGMGAAIGGASAVSIKLASDFQSSMDLIQTQAGASAQEVENMRGVVLNLATSTGESTTALAQGLFYVESAGYRGAQAMDILKLAAEGAAVGHADLAQTANVLTTVMTSGIGGVHNASDAMGVLNATIGAGKMQMSDLIGAMSTGILPTAEAAGISMQQLGATLATLTNNGVPAVDAATRLRMTIGLMVAPSGAAEKAMKGIGLQSDQLAKDMQSGGIIKAVTDLHDHLKDLSSVQQEQVLGKMFGTREGSTIMTLVGNVDMLNNRLGQIKGTSNDFGSAWQKTQGDADTAMQRLLQTVNVLAIDFGTQLLPKVTTVANYLATNLIPTVKNLVSWIEQNKTILEIIAGVITAVVVPAWAAFQAKAMVQSAKDVAAFIIENDKLILRIIAQTAQIIIAIAQWIIYHGIQIAGTLATIGMTAATWLLNAALIVLTSPITLIILAIIALIAIGVLLITHWKQVQEIMKEVWDGIMKIIQDAVSTAGQWIKNFINGIIDGINTLIHGINSVSGKIPGVGGLLHIPDIPHFDKGGYVPSTGLAMLHKGEFVLSNDMISGNQSMPTQISNAVTNNTPVNIYATINSDMDLNLLGYKLAFAVRNSR